MRRAALAIALVVAAGVPSARAHTTATGLATLTLAGTAVDYRLGLVLSELPDEPQRLLAAAAAGDPGSAGRVAEAVRRSVHVRLGDGECRPGRITIQGSQLGDARVTLTAALRCPSGGGRLVLRDDWFDVFGEHYRTIVRVDAAGRTREVALVPDSREAAFDLGAARGGLGSFVWLGVAHIMSGYDHLLFLAALLLRGGRLLALLKIVTAFTVAHSVTLALAVLGIVTIPAHMVEPAIAASIVWVALENVFGREPPARRWVVSFLFGLVHGFGFASALDELSLPRWSLAMALLGFNVGVEAGQAMVIAAALPVLLALRTCSWEARVTRAASLLVAVVGAAWLVQRLLLA